MLLGLNDSLVCLLISFFFHLWYERMSFRFVVFDYIAVVSWEGGGTDEKVYKMRVDHSTDRTRHKMHLKPLFFLIFYLNVPFSLLRNEISWFKHKHNSIKMTMLKSVRASDRSLSIEWNNRKKWINFFFLRSISGFYSQR